MGFVDRGGGREAKGASLRHFKKNPGAPAARKASSMKVQPLVRVEPDPPAFNETMKNVDASVAILSRKFGTGYSEVLLRAAREGGVAATLAWSGNFEQQEMLIEACRQHNAAASVLAGEGCGKLYCLIGVHVDSVDRTHKQQQEKWMESISTWLRHQEVLGVLSGLNLSRDCGTHFAQECLLKELWWKAGELQLPIVLHICPHDHSAASPDTEAENGGEDESSATLEASNMTVDRAAELLGELLLECGGEDRCNKGGEATRKGPTAVVLYNGVGALSCSSAMRELVARCTPEDSPKTGVSATRRNVPPIYILATAEGITRGGDTQTYRPSFVQVLRKYVKPSQLVIGTGSPWNTPQNIPDKYICSIHNEPANIRYVALAVHNAIRKGISPESPEHEEFCRTVRENFLCVFFSSSSCSKNQQQQQTMQLNEVQKSEPVGRHSKPPVYFDPSIQTSTDAMNSSPESTRYYLCLKCRRKLFHERALLTHPPDAARAHFMGKQSVAAGRSDGKGKRQPAVGSCDSVCFLRVTENEDGEWCVEESDIVIHRANATVSCGGCGSKLGSAADSCSCPCGCTIAGTTARLVAAKVEAPIAPRAGGDLDELLLEAAREREMLQLEAVQGGDDAADEERRKAKEPKKNVKANNRSNFTHFRNKNFAPKQSKIQHDADSDFAGSGSVDGESDGGNNGLNNEITAEADSVRHKGRCKQKKKSIKRNAC
uniref:TatD related DNase n=1 Tax=Trypanosoma congolense (strain IL3000) TaxID=1068625 RepID=G0UK29_TRYCI|nr:conserved hypothetical protein [Trypanosoma congolense IL3000]